MQQSPGTNADSDATWHRSQANVTARTRRRIASMNHQSNGNRLGGQIALRCPAMRKLWILAGMAMLAAACTDSKSPLAPTAVASPLPPLTAPPLPTNVPGVLAVSMPVAPGDSANINFGIAPFGYHGADHAADGHTGWDIEYRIGGTVRAAAAGTIESVIPDTLNVGHFTVAIEHSVGTHFYRTSYTNLASVNPDIIEKESVIAGQPLGPAGTLTFFRTEAPRRPVSYAMTHFQLDDFEYYRDVNHPNAVSPEPFL